MFKFDTISRKILLFLLTTIIFITVVIAFTSYSSLSRAYKASYNDKALLCNNIVRSSINGDDLIPYIEKLKNNPELMKNQQAYLETKQEIIKMESSYNDKSMPTLYYKLKSDLVLFHNNMQLYKDTNYYEINNELNELKKSFDAKYLYILADTGIEGLYTYIFDAHDKNNFVTTDRDDYGTVDLKANYDEVTKIFETGEQMKEASFLNSEQYGAIYYVYGPILDSNGEVVAIVGTDIDLTDMVNANNRLIIIHMAQGFFSAVCALFICYYFLKSTIIDPVNSISDIAEYMSKGIFSNDLPPKLLAMNDEIGALSRAFNEMKTQFDKMLTISKDTFDRAIEGNINVRNDVSKLHGDMKKLLIRINSTFEILKSYFDNIPAVVFVMDGGCEITFSNKLYREYFTDMNFFDLLNAVGDTKQAFFLFLTSDEDIYTKTGHIKVQTGETKCFSFAITKIYIDKVMSSCLVIASDVTALSNAIDSAEKASKAKSEFLSRVSHELRTPMNVILSMSKLGLDKKETPEKSMERFANIANASNHLLNIINDVLDMSKMESGKMTILSQAFSLDKLLNSCMVLFELPAKEKNIDFKLTNHCKHDVVLGDEFRLRQIIINIIGNAIKFTDENGKISVSASQNVINDNKLITEIIISDTGIGMTTEFLDRIFTPFEQEETYLKRNFQGTGLGLAISNTLVSLMGGTIEVTSAVGSGSTFIIKLPLDFSHNAVLKEGLDISETKDLSSYNLLLADDIAINREILLEVLHDTGIGITEAVDGQDCINIFANSPVGHFHIILMDIQMPQVNGYAATKGIRALNRSDSSIPIIAMTANVMEEDIKNAFDAGMNGHISKPINFEECKRAIYEHLNL